MVDKKKSLNEREIINKYKEDGVTINSLAKEYQIKNGRRRISAILRNSDDPIVRKKQDFKGVKPSKEICNIDCCDKRVYSNKMCKQHYLEYKDFGRILNSYDKRCCFCGKEDPTNLRVKMKYYCQRHKQQLYHFGKCIKTIYDGNEFIEYNNYYAMTVYYGEKDSNTLISKESYEKVKKYNWRLRHDGYVEASVGVHKKILLHRYLTDFKYENVDHINRNKLDNRLENLREATSSQNEINKSIMKNNTSGVTGVSWDKDRNKWHVMISYEHHNINLGRFDSFNEAVKVRYNAEKKYHKEFIPIERKTSMKIKDMENLISELNNASDLYYNTGHTIMTDQEFDRKIGLIEHMENELGIVLSNSPTHRIGYKVATELPEVEHSHLMLSQKKIHSVDEIINFANSRDIYLSLKLDGLSLSLHYDNITKELDRMETRGDGRVGSNALIHSSSFENVPSKIKIGGYEIDGEAIIQTDHFAEINSPLIEKAQREARQKGLNDKDFDDYVKKNSYATCRNLASGTLSLLDNSISAKRHMRFIAWNVISGCSEQSYKDRMKIAEGLGFEIAPNVKIYTSGKTYDELRKELESKLEWFRQIAEEKHLPYDGVVVSYDDTCYVKELGNTDKIPRGSVAYKYEDDLYATKLKYVEYSIGKTGVLTPTAIFEPVVIDNTVVERASLYNISSMQQLGITNNCTCYVKKCNMIIPAVASCDDDGDGNIEVIDTCPYCGKPTEIRKDNESEILVCTNENCKGKLLGRLSHFVSKNAMNIDGLSEATLDFLIKHGWVNSFIDLYSLAQYRDKWIKYDGFGIKSVDKLLSNIEKSKNTNLTRFIYSLSCPLIGNTASKSISKHISSYSDFIDKVKNHYDWTILDDFGQKMSDSLDQFFNEHLKEVNELSKLMAFEEKTTKITGILKDLSSLTFVITGSVHAFHNRDEIKAAIEEHNGKVTGSVTSKTSFLVCNEVSDSGKSKKARELGIKQITEEELISMMY